MSGAEKGYVSSKYVSADSDKGTASILVEEEGSNFTVDYGSLLQNVKRIAVCTVQFPNNFYNIISDRGRNVFSYTYNSTDYSFNVTPGFYNISRLFTVIMTEMKAQQSGQTFVLDLQQDTGKTYIQQGTLTVLPFTIKNTTIWTQLGFNSDTLVTDASFYVAPDFPALQGLTKVFLNSNALALGAGIDVGGEQKSQLMAIPVNQPFGAMVLFECKQEALCEITYPTRRNLQIVDFQLVDRNNEVVYLQGGTLKVELRVWFDTY